MSILTTFFIGITTFLSGLIGHPTVTQPVVSVPKTPQEQILGTWKETFLKSGDVTTTPEVARTYYLGFIRDKSTPYLRTYIGPSDIPKSIYSLSKWSVQQSTTSNSILLQEFYYDSDLQSEDRRKMDTFRVSFPSNEEMVLTRLNSDGSIPDSPRNSETHYKRVGDRAHEEKKVFTRSSEETKKLCEDILSADSVSEDSVLLPISCTVPLGKEKINNTFVFSVDGKITVSQNGKTLLTFSNEDSTSTNQYAETMEMSGANGPFLNTNVIKLMDITYDGYLDLKVLTNYGAYNFTYAYYIYNPTSHTFEASPILSEVTNPNEDFTGKNIMYLEKGRGIGDLYNSGIYSFKDGKYVLIYEESQDFVPNCEDVDCDYIHIIKNLKKGKMVVTKKEKLTSKQVLGD